MAGGKETPRQKMIGMMYLVLTALLAMNISKDVLNAFLQINQGLLRTSAILEGKAQATLAGLNNPKPEDAEKAKPYQAKAKEVADKSDQLVAYFQELKARTMACSMKGNKDGSGFEEFMVGNKAVDPATPEGKLLITKPDENQNNTTLLIGPKPEDPRKDPFSAYDLRIKLEEFREYLKTVSVVDITGAENKLSDDLKASIDSSFTFLDKEFEGRKESWEVQNFFHSPLVAVIATMTRLETDVLNAKTSVISELASKINATDMKFTDVTVAVVPMQSYVLKGDEYSAEIFLAAYNKSSQTKIYMGGEYSGDTPPAPAAFTPGSPNAVSNEEGKCIFKVNTGGMSLGAHGYRGMIGYLKNGKEEFIPFVTQPFFVGEPALVVSPTQMNVFYRGLPNPVEISVPGVDKSAIKTSITGATMTGPDSKNEYIVSPGQGTEAIISVTATINGKATKMGDKKFRIKPIPDPVPSFNGKRPYDSSITQSDASAAAGLRAAMENFDFPVTPEMKSWMITIVSGGSLKEYQCNGAAINPDASAAIKKAKKGDKIFIEQIKVKMPDGKDRQLPPLTLKLV